MVDNYLTQTVAVRSTVANGRVSVLSESHIAGTVSTAIDIMVSLKGTGVHRSLGKCIELLGILITDDAIDGSLCLFVGNLIGSLGFQNGSGYLLELINVLADLFVILYCQPGGDVAVDVCLAVPYPGSAVYLYLGATQDVGVGSLLVVIHFSQYCVTGNFLLFLFGFIAGEVYLDISVSTAVNVVAQFAALDMYQGTSIYGTEGTSAIDITPDEWHDVALAVGVGKGGGIRVHHVYQSVAVDSSHLIIIKSISFLETLSTAKYFSEDVATGDIDEGGIVLCLIAKELACSLVEL